MSCATAFVSPRQAGRYNDSLSMAGTAHISLGTVALALQVDRRTVERWRANRSVRQGKTRERLADLVALRDQLLRVFGTPERAQEWFRGRSRYLGGLTPVEALRVGWVDRVRADLDGLAGGGYL